MLAIDINTKARCIKHNTVDFCGHIEQQDDWGNPKTLTIRIKVDYSAVIVSASCSWYEDGVLLRNSLVDRQLLYCSDDLRRMVTLLIAGLIPVGIVVDAFEEEFPYQQVMVKNLRLWAHLSNIEGEIEGE